MTKNANVREVELKVNGLKASDGDGVQLTRVIGGAELNMFDPFLLFDAFGSDKPQDYIGGFPAHPHRGFETVTYMLAGKMRHKDSAGNEGVISAGDIQWMTAGKGIIHSEMPEQEQGLLAGFQLWVNLPATDKMSPPRYQEYKSDDIATETIEGVGSIKVIAGKTANGTEGVIDNTFTSPIYWHVELTDSHSLIERLPTNHNAFIYVIKGEIKIGKKFTKVTAGQLAVLTLGEQLTISNQAPASYLVIAGQPLQEPVFRNGPFVMNSKAEIYQAFADYQAGTLA